MMKTKSIIYFCVKIFLVTTIILLYGCTETFNDSSSEGQSSAEESVAINQILGSIDMGADIIIVEKDASIQEALDEAATGSYIFIEPGTYTEALSINKEDVKLIGLSNAENEVIIENSGNIKSAIHVEEDCEAEMHNIQLCNYNRNMKVNKYNCKHKGSSCILKDFSREDLDNDIAHYQYLLKLGEGEFDVVNIHRVVREFKSGYPVRTKGDIFMVHGAIQDFDDIFLTAGAEVINEETSAPYFLAANDIDVWGIDLGWTRVPVETEDFEFMKDWGVVRDIDHTLQAIKIARIVRGFTGQGCDKMNLLGFSYGVAVAYGAAGRETNMPQKNRNVKCIIPTDSELITDNEANFDIYCSEALLHLDSINAGVYYNPWGIDLIQLGSLALHAPDDPSPVPDFTGLTNLQVIMAIGSDHSAEWHFFGGTPFEFYYTDPMRFVRLCVNLTPYMPRLAFYEFFAPGCPDLDVSWDDNMDKIKVPILTITSQGGYGPFDDYTSSLTKSKDISRLIIEDPERDAQTGYGHGDLWLSYLAADMMWEDLRQWLIIH